MAHIVIENGQTILRDDWSVEDVQSVADCMDMKLTDKKAEMVLAFVAETFDANIGVNWEVMENAIDSLNRMKWNFKWKREVLA